MSQKGESYVSNERKDVISVILTPKNYVPWNKEATLICGKLYGRLADVQVACHTNCLPLWRKTTCRSWCLVSLHLRGKLFERAYERYYAKLNKIADTKPLMYFSLLASYSTESMNIVSQSANYLMDCEKNRDSDVLAIIVRKAHYTEVSGDTPLRKHNTRAKMEMKFSLFRMKLDMTLGHFYEQFVEHRKVLIAQRDAKPHPKREAQNFLLSGYDREYG